MRDGDAYFFVYRPIPILLISLVAADIGLAYLLHGLHDLKLSWILWGVGLLAPSLWVALVSLRWIWRWLRTFFI